MTPEQAREIAEQVTRDLIDRVLLGDYEWDQKQVEGFLVPCIAAALLDATKQERERCALIVLQHLPRCICKPEEWVKTSRHSRDCYDAYHATLSECAAAIREGAR